MHNEIAKMSHNEHGNQSSDILCINKNTNSIINNNSTNNINNNNSSNKNSTTTTTTTTNTANNNIFFPVDFIVAVGLPNVFNFFVVVFNFVVDIVARFNIVIIVDVAVVVVVVVDDLVGRCRSNGQCHKHHVIVINNVDND
jgi:hypothetical protein